MEHYTYEGFKNFLDTHDIPETLPKKGCEKVLPFLYTKRMKEYTDDLERLWCRYANLQRAIKRADDYLKNSLLENFSYKDQANLKPELPEIDFSDIYRAKSQLTQAERILFSEEFKNQQIAEAERIKSIERADFLHKVIQEVPEYKDTICLTTYAHPFAPDQSQENYSKMWQLHRRKFVKQNFMGETIFFAFYLYNTPEDLEYIISEWDGVPKYTTVKYFRQPTTPEHIKELLELGDILSKRESVS